MDKKSKKAIRSMFAIMMVFAIILTGIGSSVFAADNTNTTDTSVSTPTSVSLQTSLDSLVLDYTSCTEIVNAFIQQDNTSTNVTEEASWNSNNPAVAVAYEGRIRATGKGQTTVSVSYNGLTKNISVKVLKDVDVKAMFDKYSKMYPSKTTTFNSMSVIPNSMSGGDRQLTLQKAAAMTSLSWTPVKTMAGWGCTFPANVVVLGIPYSQRTQEDDIGFRQALNYSDFYTGLGQPNYGSDCSGFVSFSWFIPRQTTSSFVTGIRNGTYAKVGSYDANSPTYSQLMSSYPLLQGGDAVVYNTGGSGHTFLIGVNMTPDSKVMCYEQTPPQATISTYSYSTLANAGYMPFTKN